MKPHDWHRRWSKFYAGLGGAGGVVYTLLDQFITARSAGAVNGTAAEPTGQTRTVTDTNSKLSISGGVAVFATGGVGAGDPGLWYSTITTVLGTVGIGIVTPGNASSSGEFGWDNNQSGALLNGIRFTATNVLNVLAAGVGINIGAFTASVTYSIAVIQRSAGFWFFIKGGSEFPLWTLVWIGITTAPGAEFLTISAISTTSIFTADNMRVPVPLYIPVPLAYDTFTRANGALGSTETSSPDGVVIAALVWNFTTGKWAIVTNVAIGTPTQGADVVVDGAMTNGANWTQGSGWVVGSGVATATAASTNLTAAVAPLTLGIWYQTAYDLGGFAAGTVRIRVGGTNMPTRAANGTYTETNRAAGTSLVLVGAGFTGTIDNVSSKPLTLANLFASVLVATADVIADVAITLPSATAGLQAGLVLNLDSTSSPANFILVYLDGGGNVQIDECVAGVYTAKQTTAVTYVATAVLRVERSGTELRAFYNNLAVGVAQTMTANVNKNHGLFSTSPSNSLDGFTLWARGTSGEYEGALNPL